MRHNPAAGAITIMLRSLKMHGMAQAVGELTEQGSPAFEAALPILSQLLKAETADREVRSTAYQLKAARFPTYRDLAGFDFASSEVNEALVRQLHRCEFLEDTHNVVLVGGPGTGKTAVADRDDVFTTGRVLGTGEFQDEGLVERRNCREVEAVEALDRREPRFLDPTLHHAAFSIDQLQFDEAQEKADMVETFGSALPSKLLILAQERRQLERLQVMTEKKLGCIGHDDAPVSKLM